MSKNTQTTLSQFLEVHKMWKNDNGEYPNEITHTILGENPSQNASFHIPEEDMDTFFALYQKEVFGNERIFGLIERHKKYGPIVIDIDFKIPEAVMEKDERGFGKRRMTMNHIRTIVGLYMTEIEAIFNITDRDNLMAFVFERPTPYKINNIYKDGIHIMFPYIISTAWPQYYLRDRVLAKLKEKVEILADIKYNNALSDVIDRSVIEKNGWYLFRSTKPKIPPYDLRYIFDRNMDKMSPEDVELEGFSNMAYFFSIRRYDEKDSSNIKEEHAKEIEKLCNANAERETAKFMSSMRRMQKNYCDINQINKLLECLNNERADCEPTWMEVGWCLYNIDKNNIELLNAWIKFSQRSKKFKKGECENKWHREMGKRNNGKQLGIGSLYYWAKTDNPEKYMEIKRTDIRKLINDSLTNTNVDVSRVLFEMFKDQYKLASTKPATWYEFREHRWYQIENGISLRKRISTELLTEYAQMISNNNIESSAISDNATIDAETKKQKMDEIKENNEKIKKVITSLKSTTFKDKVMKEVGDLFYDEEFLKKLDENPNLVCFNNGVLDLKANVFRDGEPDDYISMSTNIDYIPLDTTTQEYAEVEGFLKQVFTIDAVRHYTLKWMASLFEGYNKDEKLHVLSGAVGSNGKSKTNELLIETLGDYAGKFNTTLLTGKRAASNAATPDLSGSKGKRYMYMEEPSDGERFNIGIMKEFSGGDKIKCRGLYQAPIEFKPMFKMGLICNDKPKVSATDGGSWRRLVVIEFTSKFVDEPKESNEFKRDRTISEKLKNWKETFAAILIKYYRIYKDEGLKAPAEIEKYTSEYQSENDIYAEYVNTHFNKTDNLNAGVELDEVFDEFKEWMQTNNPGARVPSKKDMIEYVCKKYSKKYITADKLVGFEKKPNQTKISSEPVRMVE